MPRSFFYMAALIEKSRLALNLSQTDLSKILGYKHPQYISNIERGISSIPAKSMYLWAYHLRVSVKDLIKAAKKDLEKNLVNEVLEGADANLFIIDKDSGTVFKRGVINEGKEI